MVISLPRIKGWINTRKESMVAKKSMQKAERKDAKYKGVVTESFVCYILLKKTWHKKEGLERGGLRLREGGEGEREHAYYPPTGSCFTPSQPAPVLLFFFFLKQPSTFIYLVLPQKCLMSVSCTHVYSYLILLN
jgi:hypothetical protein